jgi:hypothetical protein
VCKPFPHSTSRGAAGSVRAPRSTAPAKRAAFASYFGPLHFLLVREIVRSLGAADRPFPLLLDLGCGTGVGGAAWASEVSPSPRVIGVDRNPWAAKEAAWTYGRFGLDGSAKALDVNTFKAPGGTAILAAFILNELPEDVRERWQASMLASATRGYPVLVVEPIAKKLSPWWDAWAEGLCRRGGRSDEWRFRVELPERLALMDKAAGLDHRELTGARCGCRVRLSFGVRPLEPQIRDREFGVRVV